MLLPAPQKPSGATPTPSCPRRCRRWGCCSCAIRRVPPSAPFACWLASHIQLPAIPLQPQIDLTGNIGRKRVCSLASRDFESQSSEAIDMCILDHGCAVAWLCRSLAPMPCKPVSEVCGRGGHHPASNILRTHSALHRPALPPPVPGDLHLPPLPCRSGVHLIFEAEGSANPLDSPSILFVTVSTGELVCKAAVLRISAVHGTSLAAGAKGNRNRRGCVRPFLG